MNIELRHNEILQEFFTDADESLDTLEQGLIWLEAMADGGSTDAEAIGGVVDILHTLKGAAGVLGLKSMAQLAQVAENLLKEIKASKVAVTKTVIDALLQTNDMLKDLLAKQKNREDDSDIDNSALLATLERLAGVVAPEPGESGTVEPIAASVESAVSLDEVLNDPWLDPSLDKGKDELELGAIEALSNGPQAGPLLGRQSPTIAEKRHGNDRRQGGQDRRLQSRRSEDIGETRVRSFILNALLVGASNEGFAIPMGGISEVIKFEQDSIRHVDERDIIELRGEPLPLVYAHALSRNNVAAPLKVKASKPTHAYVVVVREGEGVMGLVVDELRGHEEVLVNGAAGMFGKAIAGATITGDGKAHMILDVPSLIKGLSEFRAG